MVPALAALAIVLLATTRAFAAGRVSGRLNVHLVCHSHDDAGWLKTVDQYYYGANNTIAHAGVQYILDSVVAALEADPARKFVYVEQAFMWRWWRHQGPEKRELVRKLVSEGRLSFINGGWVMHDEATAHYVGMVDQTHLGHAFLRREFGEDALPRVAWQIDPFGHSATQASLLGAQAGFDALYFGRIDYQDRAKRIADADMEMVWRASRSLEDRAQIFTGAFHSGNYGPPVGFCFDQACQDEPIMDDPLMADFNVERRASDFADACQELGTHTRGDDVMLQMGGDFGFEDANAWFKNLDALVEAVNREGRVNAFYSTPELYTEAKHAMGLDWSVKKDDFFPYADCPNCYWTGFYTSRPGLKRLERVTSGYLQAARQLLALDDPGVREDETSSRRALEALERAQALLQHHDGVTGTSKQHVAEDYAQRLDRARVRVETAVSAALSRAAFGTGGAAGKKREEFPRLSQCRLANVSICDATMEAEDGFVAVIYNPLAQHRSGFVDVPISWPEVSVTDARGSAVDYQIISSLDRSLATAANGFLERGDTGRSDGSGQHLYTLVLPIKEANPLAVQVFHVARRNKIKRQGLEESADIDVKKNPSIAKGKPEYSPKDPLHAQGAILVNGRHEDDVSTRTTSREGSVPTGDGHAGYGSSEAGIIASKLGTDQARFEGAPQLRHTGGDSSDFSISNDLVTLTFDGATGRLARMETHGGVDNTKDDGAALDLDQGWFFYPTFERGEDRAGSGLSGGKDGEEVDGLTGLSAAAEASRLHGELPERLRASEGQEGGAYIFRPEAGNRDALPVGGDGEVLSVKEWRVVEGPLVSEVHQVFSDWVTQTIRLRRGESHAELDWSIGPVPVGTFPNGGQGAAGKEVISRFSTRSMSSEGVFYTDANGREFQRRVRNERPTWDLNVTQPIASNYYPVTAAAFVRDEAGDNEGVQLSVLTDRAQGCSSLADGELELMAHRRLLTEDQRGVGEALNETTGGMSHFPDWKRKGEGEVFRGTHYLVLSRKEEGMKAVRTLMDEIFSPFVAAFGEDQEGTDARPLPLRNDIGDNVYPVSPARELGGIGRPRPENVVKALGESVGLMTLMREDDHVGTEAATKGSVFFLVRLAHRYAKGEDALLSLPATVDLSQLIRGYSLVTSEEIALTGGSSLATRSQKLEWTTADKIERVEGDRVVSSEDLRALDEVVAKGAAVTDESLGFTDDNGGFGGVFRRNREMQDSKSWEITIGPMEIKTFRLEMVRGGGM